MMQNLTWIICMVVTINTISLVIIAWIIIPKLKCNETLCNQPIIDNTTTPPGFNKPIIDGIEMNPPDKITASKDRLQYQLDILHNLSNDSTIRIEDDEYWFMLDNSDKAFIIVIKHKMIDYVKSQISILNKQENENN